MRFTTGVCSLHDHIRKTEVRLKKLMSFDFPNNDSRFVIYMQIKPPLRDGARVVLSA